MRRALVLAALGLLASSGRLASASPASAREAERVRAAELKRFEVTTRGDLDELARLLADDLTYTHSTGVIETKAQFLDALRSGKVRYERIEPEELQVRAYGTTAVITGKAQVSVVSDGQPKSIVLRFTDVWVKRGGRWQMVAWQSTRLP